MFAPEKGTKKEKQSVNFNFLWATKTAAGLVFQSFHPLTRHWHSNEQQVAFTLKSAPSHAGERLKTVGTATHSRVVLIICSTPTAKAAEKKRDG